MRHRFLPIAAFCGGTIVIFSILPGCAKPAEKAVTAEIFLGDLIAVRGKSFQYVRGNVIDSKNVSIDYLEGNVAGEKTHAVFVNAMKGNVESGSVTVNVLRGDIIDGENVTVSVLIGRDFSGKAKIGKIVP